MTRQVSAVIIVIVWVALVGNNLAYQLDLINVRVSMVIDAMCVTASLLALLGVRNV